MQEIMKYHPAKLDLGALSGAYNQPKNLLPVDHVIVYLWFDLVRIKLRLNSDLGSTVSEAISVDSRGGIVSVPASGK